MNKRHVSIMGFDLTPLSSAWQHAIATSCVLIGFIVYTLLQEHLFKGIGFRFPVWHSLFQTVIYTLLSFLEARAYISSRGLPGDRVHIWVRGALIIGVCTLATRTLANTAVGLLDVSVKTIFQSSKVLPVMLLGRITGTRYTAVEYALALCMAMTLAVFGSAESGGSLVANTSSSTAFGIALVLASTFSDSLKGAVQERELGGKQGPGQRLTAPSELAFSGNIVALMGLLPLLFGSGELGAAFEFLKDKPSALFIELAMFFSGHIGSIGTLVLIQLSGSYVATIVNNFRKVLTVILSSFVFFARPLSATQILSAMLFFAIVFAQGELRRRSSPGRLKDVKYD